jgi:protein-S-isoprenylcysteine O-methyltransferase Ste14
MSLTTVLAIVWGAFWVMWLFAAFGAKRGTRRGLTTRLLGLGIAVVVIILLRVFKAGALAIHSQALQSVGCVLLGCGLALAVWARIYLGRNWGMPMTQFDEPELVTSGPYRYVRHPIYSGILVGMLGTGLATSLDWFIGLVVVGAYFIYSATIEERLMSASFPQEYRAYRARTKMLVPFLL